MTIWSAPMYSAFCGDNVSPGHDGIRPLSSVPSQIGLKKASTVIRFRKRRFDRCAISCFASRRGGNSSAHRLSLSGEPLHLSDGSNQPEALTAGGRYVSFLHRTAQAMRSSLFASATTLRSDACVSSVVLTSNSAPEPAWCDTA
jgi:hypothetical protein